MTTSQNVHSGYKGEMPVFFINGVECIALPAQLSPLNARWLTERLGPSHRIDCVGIQPSYAVVNCITDLQAKGCALLRFNFSGDYVMHQVDRLKRLFDANKVFVISHGNNKSLIEFLNNDSRLTLQNNFNTVLFYNTPAGFLYLLKRLGINYLQITSDARRFGRYTEQPLSDLGQTLYNLFHFAVPAFGYHPLEHARACARWYEAFARAVQHDDFTQITEYGDLVSRAAKDNAKKAAELTTFDANTRIAFCDLGLFFEQRLPVDIGLWQHLVTERYDSALYVSTGMGQAYKGEGVVPIYIVELHHTWRRYVDLRDFVDGAIRGTPQPNQLRLERDDYQRFELLWEQRLPRFVREGGIPPRHPQNPNGRSRTYARPEHVKGSKGSVVVKSVPRGRKREDEG